VHTPSGALPIESLCAGARVLAWDRERGCVESRVLDVHRNYAEELVALATHNGEMFATCSHPYWVVDRASWLRAAHLERGMTLKLVDGSTTEVTRVARVAANEPTFNLTVETYHTYWVSFAGILVHNDEKVSAYADATTYDTKIYRVVNRETGEVVYVGKTDQPLPDRLYQHATKEESALFLEDPADRARFDEIYRIEQVREGRWTTYESNVWEQHQMDVERANGAKLRNRQEGIDWAKGEKYVEMHNPCR
jgi:hypothetical protein